MYQRQYDYSHEYYLLDNLNFIYSKNYFEKRCLWLHYIDFYAVASDIVFHGDVRVTFLYEAL